MPRQHGPSGAKRLVAQRRRTSEKRILREVQRSTDLGKNQGTKSGAPSKQKTGKHRKDNSAGRTGRTNLRLALRRLGGSWHRLDNPPFCLAVGLPGNLHLVARIWWFAGEGVTKLPGQHESCLSIPRSLAKFPGPIATCCKPFMPSRPFKDLTAETNFLPLRCKPVRGSTGNVFGMGSC